MMGSVGGGHLGLQLRTAVLDYGRVHKGPQAHPGLTLGIAGCRFENRIKCVDQQGQLLEMYSRSQTYLSSSPPGVPCPSGSCTPVGVGGRCLLNH